MGFSSNFSNLNPFNGTSPISNGIPSQFLNPVPDDSSDLNGLDLSSLGLGTNPAGLDAADGFESPAVGTGTSFIQQQRAAIFKKIFDKINAKPDAETVALLEKVKFKEPISATELPEVSAHLYEAAMMLLDDLKRHGFKDNFKMIRLQELLRAKADLVTEYGSTDAMVWLAILFDETPENTSHHDFLEKLYKEWSETDQFPLTGKAASDRNLSPEEKTRVTRILQDQLNVSMSSLDSDSAQSLVAFFEHQGYMDEAKALIDAMQIDPSTLEADQESSEVA